MAAHIILSAPAQDQPDYEGGEKSGSRVNFRFHGVKPVAVGDHECQGGGGGRAVSNHGVQGRLESAAHLAHQVHYAQVKKHHRQGTDQWGDQVDPGADVLENREHGEQPAHEQIEGTAGGMGDAEDIGGSNELAAIPEGDRGRHGFEIQYQGNQENRSRHPAVNAAIVIVHYASVSSLVSAPSESLVPRSSPACSSPFSSGGSCSATSETGSVSPFFCSSK